MKKHYLDRRLSSSRYRKLATGTALSIGLFAAASAAIAQSAYIVGGLGNFDAANYEGRDANGFEVQIEGIQAGDLSQSWTGNKFGNPVVVPYATGVYVRYQSAYDPAAQRFVSATVPKTPGVSFAGTCYMGSPSYYQAGCDHFGVHLLWTAMGKATSTSYRWMFADPANPGQLVASTNTVTVPTPTYYFMPPPVNQPTAPPVLVAEIQLPPPPPPPVPVPVPQYGDATWMKVLKTELAREVALDELTADNPVVPLDATQVETNWVLMQPSPPPDGNHRQRGRHVNQGSPNIGSRAVIRRYESYAYTGAYDPITHEAACGGDGSCNAPVDGELGDMLVAQMAAANIAVPSLSIAKNGTGAGDVSSSDKVLSCGSKCTSTYALGSAVSLTAKPASNSSFTGWSGACAGAALTCNVTVDDSINVIATFAAAVAAGGAGGGGGTAQYTLSVSNSNPGAITGTPAGSDRAINCGSSCSAKFFPGTIVALTATPPAGKQFLGWSGACAGTARICSVQMTGNLSAKASFSK